MSSCSTYTLRTQVGDLLRCAVPCWICYAMLRCAVPCWLCYAMLCYAVPWCAVLGPEKTKSKLLSCRIAPPVTTNPPTPPPVPVRYG